MGFISITVYQLTLVHYNVHIKSHPSLPSDTIFREPSLNAISSQQIR